MAVCQHGAGQSASVTTTGLKAETNTYDKGNLIQSVTGGYGTQLQV